MKSKRKNTILLGLLFVAGPAGIAYVSIEAIATTSYRDSRDKMYWRIVNETGGSITVLSDDSSAKIRPGKRAKLYRLESFVFVVRTKKGQEKEFETNNHVVKIKQDRRGKLRIRSYIE
ncbi:hypothetical protein ACFLX2_00425 [Candidatus Dependentiae bacterium]